MATATPVRSIEGENYHHFVMDIAWFGIALAATSRFLQFFALRLGASPMDLGWITSIPAIILIVAVALSQWWRSRYSSSIEAVWIPSIIFRLVFLLPAFAPFFPPEWRVPWIIIGATLPAIGQGMASAIFAVMMRETIYERDLPPLLTQRNRVMNVCITLGAVAFGFMLEHVAFPLNYQIMFVVAFVASMVSQWHLSKIRLLEANDVIQPQKEAPLKRSFRDLMRDTRFQSVVLVSFVSYVTFHLIFSLVPLQLKDGLNATESFMGIYGAVEVVAGFTVTFGLNTLIKRLGNRGVVAWSLGFNALAAVVLALAPNLWVTLISAALTGASWSAIGVCVFGFFAERTAPNDMSASVVYHQIVFAAIFIAPLIGSSLVSLGMSLVSVLLLGAGARLLGAFVTHYGLRLFGKKRVEPIYRLFR